MVVVFIIMIKSDKDCVSGQPRIEGHEISVRHVVANVGCLGLDGCIEYFKLGNDEGIEDKIREAVDYCRNEQCDKDNENGRLESYCHYCTKNEDFKPNKNESKSDVWKTAHKVYQLNFE